MTEPRSTGGRLPMLDGLRGLAAVGVLAYHLPAFFNAPAVLPLGFLFVDLFFLLSGFVLTAVVANNRTAGMSPLEFLRTRVRRFWPVAAIGTLIGAGVLSVGSNPDEVLGPLVFGLLFVPTVWSLGLIFPLNGPQWSLWWELFINWVHSRWLDAMGDRALLIVILIAGTALILSALRQGDAGGGPHNFDWYRALPRVVFSYAVGIFLARRWRGARWTPYWPAKLLLPILATVLLPLVLSSELYSGLLLVLIIYPLTFWWLAHAQCPERFSSLLSYLGKLSFPLYAVHLPIFMGAQLFSYQLLSGIAATAVAISVSAIVARSLDPARHRRAPVSQLQDKITVA